jgi:hypothetical protein
MAFSTAGFVAMQTAIEDLSGGTDTERTQAFATGLINTVVAETSRNYTLTPNQQNRVAQLAAEFTTNIAGVVTALNPA